MSEIPWKAVLIGAISVPLVLFGFVGFVILLDALLGQVAVLAFGLALIGGFVGYIWNDGAGI